MAPADEEKEVEADPEEGEEEDDDDVNPLANVEKIVKVPVRIAPTNGRLAKSVSMTFYTQEESQDAASQKAEEARTRRLSRSASGVKFDKVVVREFPVELGDNPAVSRGAPLTIDWEPINHIEYDLDIYEDNRKPRRGKNGLHLTFPERQKLFRECGFTGKEVTKAVIDVNNARTMRYNTVQGFKKGAAKREETLEKMKRSMTKAMAKVNPGLKKKLQEDQLIIDFKCNYYVKSASM